MENFMMIIGAMMIAFVGFKPAESSVTINQTEAKVFKSNVDESNVFLISKNEAFFEDLSETYSGLLLSAFENDMNVAFKEWRSLVVSFEQFAKDNSVNINGVKIWLKVFWNEAGEIDYIAYDLKPNSRNIDTKQLQLLLEGFTASYQIGLIETEEKFSHYGSASFPSRPLPVYAE